MEENVTKVINQLNQSVEEGLLSTIQSITINETVDSVNNTLQLVDTTVSSVLNDSEPRISGTLNILDSVSSEEVWLWIFAIYCGNIALGVIFNAISFVSLLRTKRNGTLSIILQLTSIDMFSSWVCIVELLSIKRNAWKFPAELCPFFAGSETLSNTLILYLIISLNYHTISLCNIKTLPAGSCEASQECLVRDLPSEQGTSTTSGSSTSGPTSINQPNQTAQPKRDISVVIPCILIWFTCLSLSIPQFTLSSTVESHSSKNITCTCTLMDDSMILINLLAVFRVFIPTALLLSSFCIVCYKLVRNVRNDSIPAIFTKKCHNIVYYLIFCLVLNLLYVFTSLQRLILYAVYVYSSPSLKPARIYKLPPLYNGFTGSWIAIALCMLHYSGTFLRFIVYVFLLPKFKSILCNNCLTCFNPKEV